MKTIFQYMSVTLFTYHAIGSWGTKFEVYVTCDAHGDPSEDRIEAQCNKLSLVEAIFTSFAVFTALTHP